ncbi:MAG TPA: FCD domain-containing protein [Candidatus Sulfotelmatobacter sp.]|nr:FCD domain-containing protein [Candidatus Sulfotelmatobacter sp.]
MVHTANDGIRPAKLPEAIACHLESLILEGSLRSGDRLPPERELAQQLDVSRPSLRQAISLLESRALVVIRKGGTFIAPILDDTFAAYLLKLMRDDPESTNDYLEFRSGIDGMAAFLAASRSSDIDRQMIAEAFQAMERAHLRAVPDEEAEADTRFHQSLYDAGHNVVMLQIMCGLSGVLRHDVHSNRTKLYTRKGLREILLEQHRAIHDAIMTQDGPAARDAAQSHVSFTRAALTEIDRTDARLEMALRRFAEAE